MRVWPGIGCLVRMTGTIHGGRARFLDYVVQATLDGNEIAIKWWRTWERLSLEQQRSVPLDDVCAACGVPPSEFVPMIVQTAMRHESSVNDIVKASMTPGILRQMGKSARRIGGSYAEISMRDRHLFLQGAGQLPVPRNATMTVNVSASANAKAAALASSEPSMPSFLEDVSSLQSSKEQVQRSLIGEVVETDE